MNLIKDTVDLYKNSYLLTIMNITYHYYNYLLCLIYLFWYLYNIINIHKFTNENYVNNYLIFYSFYKINTFIKNIIIFVFLSMEHYILLYKIDFHINNIDIINFTA